MARRATRPGSPTAARPISPVPPSAFGAAWNSLHREIESCRRCPLHRTRRQVVVYRGGPRPRVLFVGEAPGEAEDRAGVPFVGRSGRRLDRAIEQVGLRDGEFGILNVVKCRPPGNRFLSEAARKCRPFLDRQLDLLRPQLIVTLGAHALAALDPAAPAVTIAAGRERRWGSTPLFPLLHPAAAMHAPRYRDRWESDLRGLSEFLAGLPGGR